MPICEVSNSYFNYNVAEDGGALYNVIAMQCGFGSSNFYNDISENGYNMYYGVDLDCYASDDEPDNYYDTIISVGFTLTPVKLIIVPSDNSFKVLVNNNDGDKEPIPGVEVHIEVDDGKGTLNDLPKDDYNRYYNTTNVDGIVSFPMAGLTQGYHKITVGFTNSYYQGGKESTYNVHIGLIESTIEYNKNLNFNYGGSDSLVITVVGGSVGSQNVYVVGQPNKVSVRGNTITVFGLNAGNYNLHIDTTPIEGYKSTTALVPITVNKVFAYISASSFSAVYKSKKTWTVKVRDANNKPVAGVKVKVKVGSKVVQYTTNSKGEVYFKASLFKAGKFKASISAFNGNYIITPVTSTVKITKLTNIKYDYVHAKKNGGTGLTVTVFKKGTKQSLKNVKVLVKICKGNKVVKKFTMKTKRIGKYYGFGFGINKLPKGTYAVKLSPVNKNKYKGNGQTSIKVYKKGNWFKKV
jgi:hypothetical protein